MQPAAVKSWPSATDQTRIIHRRGLVSLPTAIRCAFYLDVGSTLHSDAENISIHMQLYVLLLEARQVRRDVEAPVTLRKATEGRQQRSSQPGNTLLKTTVVRYASWTEYVGGVISLENSWSLQGPVMLSHRNTASEEACDRPEMTVDKVTCSRFIKFADYFPQSQTSGSGRVFLRMHEKTESGNTSLTSIRMPLASFARCSGKPECRS